MLTWLSRISVRGILTDVHDEIAHTQVEASNSTLYPITRTVIGVPSLKDGKGVERIDQARAPVTVEYGNRLEQIRRHRAQGHCLLPDTGTGSRALNAPVAFSPNTPVTGSVIGNRHPSCHSFCSLPHQTIQSMSGRRKQGRSV